MPAQLSVSLRLHEWKAPRWCLSAYIRDSVQEVQPPWKIQEGRGGNGKRHPTDNKFNFRDFWGSPCEEQHRCGVINTLQHETATSFQWLSSSSSSSFVFIFILKICVVLTHIEKPLWFSLFYAHVGLQRFNFEGYTGIACGPRPISILFSKPLFSWVKL